MSDTYTLNSTTIPYDSIPSGWLEIMEANYKKKYPNSDFNDLAISQMQILVLSDSVLYGVTNISDVAITRSILYGSSGFPSGDLSDYKVTADIKNEKSTTISMSDSETIKASATLGYSLTGSVGLKDVLSFGVEEKLSLEVSLGYEDTKTYSYSVTDTETFEQTLTFALGLNKSAMLVSFKYTVSLTDAYIRAKFPVLLISVTAPDSDFTWKDLLDDDCVVDSDFPINASQDVTGWMVVPGGTDKSCLLEEVKKLYGLS